MRTWSAAFWEISSDIYDLVSLGLETESSNLNGHRVIPHLNHWKWEIFKRYLCTLELSSFLFEKKTLYFVYSNIVCNKFGSKVREANWALRFDSAMMTRIATPYVIVIVLAVTKRYTRDVNFLLNNISIMFARETRDSQDMSQESWKNIASNVRRTKSLKRLPHKKGTKFVPINEKKSFRSAISVFVKSSKSSNVCRATVNFRPIITPRRSRNGVQFP